MTKLLEQASELGRIGDLDGAIELLERMLQEDPTNIAGQHSLGLFLTRRGDFHRAIETIRRVLGKRPTVPAYHVNLAEAYRSQGDLERTIGACRTALMIKPEFPEALCTLGLAFHGMKRHAEAAEEFRRALALRPNMAAAHNNLGIVLKETGAIDEAIAHFRSALKSAPDLNRARVNLGIALLESRQAEEAESHFREAIGLQPDTPGLHVNLGNALRALGRFDDARDAYLEALRLNAELPFPHLHVGATLREEGRFDEAVPWYKNAIALDPDNSFLWEQLAGLYADREDPEEAVLCWEQVLALSADDRSRTHINLGVALLDAGRPHEAKDQMVVALQLRPDLSAAHLHMGGAHEVLGEMDEAEADYRSALQLQPESALPLARLGTLLRGKLSDPDLAVLETRLADPELPPGPRARLLFALAHVFDARGDFERAAACAREANALTLELATGPRVYNPEEHEKWVSCILDVFSAEFFARSAGWGQGSRRPVFVFGLPRSGTTLVEQILASHPAIHGAGELRLARRTFGAIPLVTGRNEPPRECLRHLDADAVEQLAALHLQALDAIDGGAAARIVDKMPDNYAHVGLLSVLFPNAVFVHCRRDLRDVAVSCWMTDFGSIRWAWSRESIASRFREYLRLIEHWRAVLPIAMHEINYEETVSDLEGVARRLVAACDLDWDSSCLHFHETERPVRTASVTQVRQPIYTKSVCRWKNYSNYLSDLFELLPIDTPPDPDHGNANPAPVAVIHSVDD